MESNLVKLKSDFNNVINIRSTVKNIFDILQIRIDKLKLFYSEFIKSSQSQLFVFGLDSFHFQSKLIDIEYEDMKRLFLAINNRMYCEYFKLYKIIIEYILKTVNDKKLTEHIKVNDYPIYKDLEPFKEYQFEIILDVHENILNLLSILISHMNNKENELLIHKGKKDIGLNIDNFITSFNYNINIMREKIVMFITYIEFFHKMHTKYLKRFSNKIQLMYSHVNNDIKFDESIELSKSKKNEIIQDYSGDSIDKELLHDLRTSIHADSSDSDVDLNTPRNKTTNISNNNSNNSNNSNTSIKTYNTGLINLFEQINADDTPNHSYSQEDINNAFIKINSSCDFLLNNEQNKSDDICENIVKLIIEVKNDEVNQLENESIVSEVSTITQNDETPQDKGEPIVKPKRKYKPRKKKDDPPSLS